MDKKTIHEAPFHNKEMAAAWLVGYNEAVDEANIIIIKVQVRLALAEEDAANLRCSAIETMHPWLRTRRLDEEGRTID